jgi:secreted trypsin-like serine protease
VRLKSTQLAVTALVALATAAAALALVSPGAGAVVTGRDVKILGGSIAAPGQFPWMVALVDPRAVNAADGQFCGGSLIAPRVVITAGHCVYGATADEMDAVVGRTRLSRGDDGQRIKVTRIVRHPGYDPTTLVNDVALLQLAEPATVTPLALDGPGDTGAEKPATPVTVSGWGTTAEGGDGSDDLRFVRLRVRSASACQAIYDDVSATRTVCAGSSRAGEDSCQGDSGGPLTRGADASARLVALVSYGAGCGRRGVPGVYTRVAAFSAFIAEQAAVLNGDAPAPAPVADPPVVRIADVACGPTTCTTTFSVRNRPPAGGIVLNVVRARSKGRKAVDRFVFAKRLSATRYVAQDNLPYGRLTLYAIPLNAAQDDLDGDGDVTQISIVPA